MGSRQRKVTLSPRESQTLAALLDGLAEKQIGPRLGISKNTTHVYVKAVYRFFNVDSRSSLMAIFVCPVKRKLIERTYFTVERFVGRDARRSGESALTIGPVRPGTCPSLLGKGQVDPVELVGRKAIQQHPTARTQ